MLAAKPHKAPPHSSSHVVDDFIAACKAWQQRWEVQALRRGSRDANAAKQGANALSALARAVVAAAAQSRRGGGAAPGVSAAASTALAGVLPTLLSAGSASTVGAALADLMAIARPVPAALPAAELAPALAAVLAGSGSGDDEVVVQAARAAWIAERCVSAAAWRAADVWAALAGCGAVGAVLAAIERQAAALRADEGAAPGGGAAGAGSTLAAAPVSLLATLAAAAPRFADEMLGSSDAGALRALEALAALHAGCAFHDPARAAVARLFVALGAAPRLQRLAAGSGAGAARARALVAGVLHSVLKW